MDELNTNKENDNELDALLSESTLEMPFSDFEDNLMLLIEEKSIEKVKSSRESTLSKFFFFLGSLIGIVLTILLTKVNSTIFGMPSNIVALGIQLTFVTLFFTQIQTYLKVKKE
jgi:hypothetical protein